MFAPAPAYSEPSTVCTEARTECCPGSSPLLNPTTPTAATRTAAALIAHPNAFEPHALELNTDLPAEPDADGRLVASRTTVCGSPFRARSSACRQSTHVCT